MIEAVPVRYHLSITPDLERFTFDGRVEILVSACEPVERIELNAREIAVKACATKIDGKTAPAVFSMDAEKDALTVALKEATSGDFSVAVDFSGIINDKMVGFYRSGYEKDGEPRFIAVTQFEEDHARQAFPCMDQPLYKAVFDIEMIVDEHLTAISNSPVVESARIGNGKKRVRFEPTPRMSTYLVFLGVGEFDRLQDSEPPSVRVFTLPGKTDSGRYGLVFGKKALRFCRDYFRIPYPLSKMDLIGVPDFAFGAMENWGAITFRENLLLYDRGVTSKAGEARICEVIAHEIVHQWFGNLVSPSDWKYLWLNESFATYFGFGVVDYYQPDFGTWDRFLHEMTATAMERDALKETVPIEMPGNQRIAINAGTAPIIYNKGASVLRQIKGYIGDDHFQSGLVEYLSAHAYACAESRHLWEAFERASEMPVSSMMQAWVSQPGFPAISARSEGGKAILTQKRFTYIPEDNPQVWPIPVRLSVYDDSGNFTEQTFLMEEKEASVDLPDGTVAFKLNAGQSGFYRVFYEDRENLNALGLLVNQRVLESADRWGLQNDLYASVEGGMTGIDDYLSFLSHYACEDDFLPMASIARNLFRAYLAYGDARRDAVAGAARGILDRVLDAVGFDPSDEEPHLVSVLRDQVLWDAVLYGSRTATDAALSRFQDLVNGGTVHADIVKSVLQAGAFAGPDNTFDFLADRFRASKSEHGRMNVLMALGCFQKPADIDRALDFVLTDVPDRNKFFPITAMAANPFALSRLWGWFTENIEAVSGFHPIHFERILTAVIPACGKEQPEAVKAFAADLAKQNKGEAVLPMALEKLDIYLQMRNRA